MEPEVDWVAFMVTFGKGGLVAWLLVIAPTRWYQQSDQSDVIPGGIKPDFMWGSNATNPRERQVYSMVLP